MRLSTHRPKFNFELAFRILLAIFGGYGVAVLVDLAFLGFPMHPLSAIFWGQIASLIAFAVMIIVTFSIEKLAKLCLIFTIIASSLAIFDYFILN